MDHAVEASPQRVRDHLRRPLAGSRNLLTENARNTENETVPTPDACRPSANASPVGRLCIRSCTSAGSTAASTLLIRMRMVHGVRFVSSFVLGVVSIDPDAWDCFASLRCALRKSGIRAPRISTVIPASRRCPHCWSLAATGHDPDDQRLSAMGSVPFTGGAHRLRRCWTSRGRGCDSRAAVDLFALEGRRRSGGTPNPDLTRLLYDKLAMDEYAAGLGLPVPDIGTCGVSASPFLRGKMRTGAAGQGVRIVHAERELSDTLRIIGPERRWTGLLSRNS